MAISRTIYIRVRTVDSRTGSTLSYDCNTYYTPDNTIRETAQYKIPNGTEYVSKGYYSTATNPIIRFKASTIPSEYSFANFSGDIMLSEGGEVIGTISSDANPTGSIAMSQYLTSNLRIWIDLKLSITPPITYITLSFDANGGSGAPDSIRFISGDDVTIPSQTPTKSGFFFSSWLDEATGTQYLPGEIIHGLVDDTMLIAQYEETPPVPVGNDLLYGPGNALINAYDGFLVYG